MASRQYSGPHYDCDPDAYFEDRRADDVIDELDADGASLGSIELRRMARIKALDGAQIWRRDDCTDMVQWVAFRLGIGTRRARRLTECAHSIDRLPRIAQALRSGVLSLDKTVELTRFATPETERKLITWAKKVAPSTIASRADAECAKDEQEVEKTYRDRFMRWRRYDDAYWFEAMLPLETGEFVTKAIIKMADSLPQLPNDERPEWCDPQDDVSRRRADALYLLVGARPNVATEVVVHTTLDATGTLSNGELPTGGTLHPDVVAKMVCDSRLRYVLTDDEGNALGIGKSAHVIPSWLRQEVLYRDRFSCTFPGCDRRGFLKAHHMGHWPHGPTDLENLTTVCPCHHDLIHLHKWNVFRGSKGTLAWVRPDGSVYLPGPDPPG